MSQRCQPSEVQPNKFLISIGIANTCHRLRRDEYPDEYKNYPLTKLNGDVGGLDVSRVDPDIIVGTDGCYMSPEIIAKSRNQGRQGEQKCG